MRFEQHRSLSSTIPIPVLRAWVFLSIYFHQALYSQRLRTSPSQREQRQRGESSFAGNGLEM